MVVVRITGGSTCDLALFKDLALGISNVVNLKVISLLR